MLYVIIFILLYFIIPPGIMAAAKGLKEYLKTRLFGRRRSSTALKDKALKEGFNKKLSKRMKFTMKDPRNKPVPFRLVFIAIYAIGLIISGIAGFNTNIQLLLIAFLIAYISFAFSYVSANKIIAERDQILKRMLEMKGNKMRFINRDKGSIATPASEFKVVEWNDDLVSPKKMYLYMPTDFDSLEVDSFLESFNLVFNTKGQWIADADDEQYGGFDFNSGVAAIRVSTPLPQIAEWHERYLDPEVIHWSYFPLALGSENGVPVYNEELDKVEHVLGFAVNSGQGKLSKKNGAPIGKEITAAPQILIAGGTGGGKSLESNTKVNKLVEVDNNKH